MKKAWIYFFTIIGLLVIYSIWVVAINPKETTLYPVIIWYLNGVVVYPLISLIAGGILSFIVKDKRYISFFIMLSGFLFFVVSMMVNHMLLFFQDNHGIGLNLKCSLFFVFEVVLIQFFMVGIVGMYRKTRKKKM